VQVQSLKGTGDPVLAGHGMGWAISTGLLGNFVGWPR